MNTRTYTKGFTLFFAMLVAGLALAIGLAIYDLTIRELNLSATATQSQYAIYAADTGAECALFWQLQYVNAGTNNNGGSDSAFATSSFDTQYAASNIFCNGTDVTIAALAANTWPLTVGATFATTTFQISFLSRPYCAVVSVGVTPAGTYIESDGYNTCVSGGLQLERTETYFLQ